MVTFNLREGPPNWHFDYLAPVYDYLFVNREYKPILDGLDLRPGDRVLDLAGGTGQVLADLIKRGHLSKERSWLLDRSKNMVKQAVDKPLSNLVVGDTVRLPFNEGVFDAVFVGDALHHMGKLEEVLMEIRRILVPKGRFVIEEYDPSTITGKLLYGFERLSGMGSNFLTPDTLSTLLKQAGFLEIKIHQNGFIYYLKAVTPIN